MVYKYSRAEYHQPSARAKWRKHGDRSLGAKWEGTPTQDWFDSNCPRSYINYLTSLLDGGKPTRSWISQSCLGGVVRRDLKESLNPYI